MSQSSVPRIALYPGSFDVLTYGHVDIVERASRLFDRLIVAVAENPHKQPLFTVKERLKMLREVTRSISNVECVTLEGLTVEFARTVGAKTIIRGLRAVSDFEFELQMATMNRGLAPEIETIFLTPATEYIFLSSSSVKEVRRYHGDISTFVPKVVVEAFERLERKTPSNPAPVSSRSDTPATLTTEPSYP